MPQSAMPYRKAISSLKIEKSVITVHSFFVQK